jgi:hypothetical protein
MKKNITGDTKMIKDLKKIVFKSFKENSKPKNISNILFIEKSMNEVFKDVQSDLNNKGYFVTISLLKKYDKFFRTNNIQSVKEI